MCVLCGNNGCNCPSTTLPAGADGLDGMYGGYSSDFKFDSSVAAGPASTYLRLNNTTYSSVTTIYISDTNQDSTNVDLFLDSFDNSGNFGKIRIFKEYDSNTFWDGTITAVTDSGTYHTITVTYVLSNGTFAAGDSLVVTFAPAGGQGQAGPLSITADSLDNVSIQDITVAGGITTVTGATASLAAGTYLIFFEANGYSTTSTAEGFYGVYISGVLESDTKRFFGIKNGTAGTIATNAWQKLVVNAKVTLGSTLTVDIRDTQTVGTLTVTGVSFTYIKIA